MMATPEELEWLNLGLDILNVPAYTLTDTFVDRNIDSFRLFYGSNPNVIAQIWNDIQPSMDRPVGRVAGNKERRYFLMAHYFLKCYMTESQMAILFKCDNDTV
jgi:hypothetical protein